MRGKRRCRIHGGKAGAPKGNKNAFKHGLRSREMTELRALLAQIRRQKREGI
ncbi:hypothetical protein [Rhizorhabdus wittichii]|uniref:hypothetical protein n=1 Tax=Rhizorhabdus wittichii TaxID=160791 RepID=UPI003857E4CE